MGLVRQFVCCTCDRTRSAFLVAFFLLICVELSDCYQMESLQTQWDREVLLQKAMENAWIEYGPKTPLPPSLYGPVTQIYQPALTGDYARVRNGSSVSSGYNYNPPVLANNFQPFESEWDDIVSSVPIPMHKQVIPQPGMFTRFLNSYIDFEVNYHEFADFVRQVMFGIAVGLFLVGWIAFGVFIGFIPSTWLPWLQKRNSNDNGKVLDAEEAQNDLLAHLTDRVLLALDSDWLKKLEEKVSIGSDRIRVRTYVRCCILPDSETNGMADCQVIRKDRKMSAFKCLSNLIYNFQFGPATDTKKDVT